MSKQNVYTQRIQEHCSKCQWWNRLRCRKGHLPTSPTGCPERRFEPVNGAGYDDDREPDPPVLDMPCCGHSTSMPDLSWAQVLAMFAQAMVRWVKAGAPVVPDRIHADRLRKCDTCPSRQNFWCKQCKCVCYLKTKLATEQCPDKNPKWLRLTWSHASRIFRTSETPGPNK